MQIKKGYLIGATIILILAFYLIIVLSNNRVKTVSAERDVIIAKCKVLEEAAKHPRIVEKPVIKWRVETKTIKGDPEIIEKVVYKEVIGEKITEPAYPEPELFVTHLTRVKNWTLLGKYNFSTGIFGVGVTRRIYKTIEAGGSIRSDKTIEGIGLVKF